VAVATLAATSFPIKAFCIKLELSEKIGLRRFSR